MYGRYCREEIFVYMFIYDLNNIEHPRELIDELYSVSEVIPTGTQPGEKKTAIAAQLFEITRALPVSVPSPSVAASPSISRGIRRRARRSDRRKEGAAALDRKSVV